MAVGSYARRCSQKYLLIFPHKRYFRTHVQSFPSTDARDARDCINCKPSEEVTMLGTADTL